MVSGYLPPGGSTFHIEQRCSGTVFSGMDAIDSKVAENRGVSPCGNCCDGEWPHAEEEDKEADRDPEEWLDKLEAEETALRFRDPSWKGPEFVGKREDGFRRWPMGMDGHVGETHREQIIEDLETASIEVEAVDWSETPLAEADDA